MFMTLQKLEFLVAQKRADNSNRRKLRNELSRKVKLLSMLDYETRAEKQLTGMNKGLAADLKGMKSQLFGDMKIPQDEGMSLDPMELAPGWESVGTDHD